MYAVQYDLNHPKVMRSPLGAKLLKYLGITSIERKETEHSPSSKWSFPGAKGELRMMLEDVVYVAIGATVAISGDETPSMEEGDAYLLILLTNPQIPGSLYFVTPVDERPAGMPIGFLMDENPVLYVTEAMFHPTGVLG